MVFASTVLTTDRAAVVVDPEANVASCSCPAAATPVFKSVKQLRMRSAAAYLPHPEKESYGGEDAHFVSNISGGAIGVADGECLKAHHMKTLPTDMMISYHKSCKLSEVLQVRMCFDVMCC